MDRALSEAANDHGAQLTPVSMKPVREPNTNAFGVAVPRCQARSKRSGEQCRKAACRGKSVCRTHGGASTGPKTDAGKARCAEAKAVHGRERRTTRVVRAVKLKELRQLEDLMTGLGMMR